MTTRRTTVIFLGLTLGLIASFGLSKIQPAEALTGCCCRMNEEFAYVQCATISIPTGQSCNAVMPSGFNWTLVETSETSRLCPNLSDPETKSGEITFTPNVPIPGLFEGEQRVDGTLLSRYVRAVYVYFVWIVGILATVMVMYGSIQWITAAGNSSKIENAKSTMNGALIAIVLTLTSFLLLRLINPALVKMTDLSIFTVPTILIGEGNESSVKGPAAIPYEGIGRVANTTRWDDSIRSIANQANLDPYFVKAIMIIESRGNPDAVSPAGACGLMQVMPQNSNGVCLKGAENAEANIRAGVALLKNMFSSPDSTCPSRAQYKSGGWANCNRSQTSCTNNWHYVIAGYNGGPGANCSSITCKDLKQTWWECAENPGFLETRRYVASVELMYGIVRGWGGL